MHRMSGAQQGGSDTSPRARKSRAAGRQKGAIVLLLVLSLVSLLLVQVQVSTTSFGMYLDEVVRDTDTPSVLAFMTTNQTERPQDASLTTTAANSSSFVQEEPPNQTETGTMTMTAEEALSEPVPLDNPTETTTSMTSLEPPRSHPHAGARYPNGTWGYVADATAVRRSFLTRYAQLTGTTFPPPLSYLPLTDEDDNEVCETPPTKGFEGPNGGWEVLVSQVQIRGVHHNNETTQANNDDKQQQAPSPPTVPSSKIMCVVYTHDAAHARLRGIRETWAWRCDGFFAASTRTGGGNDQDDDLHFGAIDLAHQGPEMYDNMWQKTRSIMSYLYHHYLDDYDYFYLSGDDTLLLVENLRAYISSLETQKGFNASAPLYIGHRMFSPKGPRGIFVFAGGGSGYVINRVVLKRFVEELLDECIANGVYSCEDRFIGNCLTRIGITPIPTEDDEHRSRFHGLDPDWIARDEGSRTDMEIIKSEFGGDYHHGTAMISNESIAFHLLKTVVHMKRIHAILYRSCPVGTVLGDALAGQ